MHRVLSVQRRRRTEASATEPEGRDAQWLGTQHDNADETPATHTTPRTMDQQTKIHLEDNNL